VTPVAAVAVAALLEAAVGEPPTRLHPVAWFGRAVGGLDRAWARPLLAGALGAAVLPLGAAALAGGAVAATGAWSGLAAAVVAGSALFLSTSLRRLLEAATDVIDDSDSDIAAAREGLLALAGRDAGTLSPAQLRSAAVESAAENLADGLIAPLLAFVIGAVVGAALGGPELPLAAAAAAWVKAVNTMDSMLGYRAKRVGTPAARLDDAVMWLPARLSAVALAVALADGRALLACRRWLPAVPSPNSGWPMGVAAAALDIRLAKPGIYTLTPDAALPAVAPARRGLRGVGIAGVLSYAMTALALAPLEVSAWL
jgi:adenosylcobinamide-phosphate synthase